MGDRLRLEVPARPFALTLVRLEVGGVAALTGSLVTEVEDLQLATEELCLGLFGPAGTDGQLVVELEWDDDWILVRCSLLGGGESIGAGLHEDELPPGVVDRILESLVDEHGSEVEDGRAVRWLRKRRVSVDPGP